MNDCDYGIRRFESGCCSKIAIIPFCFLSDGQLKDNVPRFPIFVFWGETKILCALTSLPVGTPELGKNSELHETSEDK